MRLTFKCITSLKKQTLFKNLRAFAANVSDHFGTLCIKGLDPMLSKRRWKIKNICYY